MSVGLPIIVYEPPFSEAELLQYRVNLYRLALTLTRQPDQANDLVQETFFKALNKSEQFQKGTNLEAWLATILRNHHRSSLRRAGREVHGDQSFWNAIENLYAFVPAADSDKDVRQALATLAPDRLKLLWDAYVHGLTTRQMAESHGLEESTVRTRLSRTKDEMAVLLGPDYLTRSTLPSRSRLVKASLRP